MKHDEKACPACAETIKKAAHLCKHCGHKFSDEEVAAAMTSSSAGKNIGIGCLAVLGFLFLVGMCAPKPDTDQVDDQTTDAQLDALAEAESLPDSDNREAAPRGDWSYSRQRDELRGQTEYYANILSENSVSFDFPYTGGSTLRMTIRSSPQYGEDVIFRISKGQFVCGVYDCAGAISFDGRSERLTLATPADHSSDVLFAKYGGAIIRKLKSSERTIVELPFYQEGNRQFTFDTANLEWPPKD